MIRQGIVGHNLNPAEKASFFVMLRRLAERYGRLPERLMITEEMEVSDEILASVGFGFVMGGTYKGVRVAVKTATVPSLRDLEKIRKVSVDGILWSGLNNSAPAVLQGGHPLGYTVPSERLETRWSLGGREDTAIFHPFRVDGGWEHHGVHWRESH